ncbi:MAG: metal-dependent hydrolase, partial [Bradymonadaceae bacterium]
MLIPGHLSIGYLLVAGRANALGRRPHLYTELLPALIGTLTPDLLDKPMMYLGLTPYGRTVGHSLVLLVLATLVWALASQRKWIATTALGWWTVGIASHHVADFVNDIIYSGNVITAWFMWPYRTPDDWRWKIEMVLFPCHSCYTP